jgi:hypothetical protein
MRTPPRKRSLLALALLAVVALGIASRHPSMPEFSILYAGDILWGALFFLLTASLAPCATTLRLWLASTALTELTELTQLYQSPWAQSVRATRLGGLLLGHSFSWSDTLCVALGTTTAALLDPVLASVMHDSTRPKPL